MKKEELTKLFREGTIIITASGMTIKDEIIGCYTFEEDGETYIIVKFSNGHIVTAIENVKEIDRSNTLSSLCEWQYDLFNFNGEKMCSIIKIKED